MRPLRPTAMIPGALLLSLALFPASAPAQHLEFEPVVHLEGTDTLTHDPMSAAGGAAVVRLPEGGWLVTSFVERWKWAEYDADGRLRRAPGRKWIGGGPGEFVDIDYVLPLADGERVVFERFRATFVKTDGTYLRREDTGLEASNVTRIGDSYWVSGRGALASRLFLLRVRPTGELTPYTIPTGGSFDSPSGYVVRWGSELWVWEYPRGPFHRVSERTGEPLGTWDPFPELGSDGWRAFAYHGSGGTVILERWSEDAGWEWLVFDSGRRLVLRQKVPQAWLGMKFIDDTHAWRYTVTDGPLEIIDGIQIFEYRYVAGEEAR